MKKVIVYLFGMLLMACTSSKDTDSRIIVLDKTNITDKTQDDFDLSALVNDWDFVELEQNDSCLLSQIRQIKIMGEDVFIVNVEGLQSDIYHFTTDGQFRNRIGRQGIGYDFVTQVVIDSASRKVCLLDIFDSSIHHYGYEGNYLKSYKPYPLLQYVADAFYLDDHRILGYYGITRDHRLAYFTADSLLMTEDTLSYHQMSSDSRGVLNFSRNAVSRYGERTLLIQPFCDTIFEYRDRTLRPAFLTKTGASLPERYRLEGTPNCMEVKDKLEQQGYYSKSAIFETGSHIWIGCGKNRLMYDKRTNTGVYFRDSLHYHPDVYPPLDFIGRKGEVLYSLVTGSEVLMLKSSMADAGYFACGKLKDFFEQAHTGVYFLLSYRFR